MSKVITFALQKGGVGKTSISTSVAVEIANKGKRVLLIDADPQGNSTAWIGNDEIKYELADVLMEKCAAADAIQTVKNVENLFIMPTPSLGGSLRLYQKTLANEQPFAPRQLVRELSDSFDYVIFDTSPSFTALEESCLLASHEALTVLQIDEFSKDGLVMFMDNLNRMKRRYDSELPVINKIVMNGRDLRLKHQDGIIEQVEGAATGCKTYKVPVDQSFKKSQEVHVPIQMMMGTKKDTLSVINSIASDIM